MEYNIHTLREALAKLPTNGPADFVWNEIARELTEQPLKAALKELPELEPEAFIWKEIERKSAHPRTPGTWWFAAAMILASGLSVLWMVQKRGAPAVAYSQEVVDTRLQLKKELVTDQQYEKLRSYCEAETLVCNDKNFKRLQQEYETLRSAARQLQQAMGNYNTEPELIRQFSVVEQQKAEVLNEMAKMI